MSNKLLTVVAVTGLLVGASASVFAQSSPSGQAPVQQTQDPQDKGPIKGTPGATGNAPAEQDKTKATTGTAGYAPGDPATGPGTRLKGDSSINAGASRPKN
jgi:hypothetical protein